MPRRYSVLTLFKACSVLRPKSVTGLCSRSGGSETHGSVSHVGVPCPVLLVECLCHDSTKGAEAIRFHLRLLCSTVFTKTIEFAENVDQEARIENRNRVRIIDGFVENADLLCFVRQARLSFVSSYTPARRPSNCASPSLRPSLPPSVILPLFDSDLHPPPPNNQFFLRYLYLAIEHQNLPIRPAGPYVNVNTNSTLRILDILFGVCHHRPHIPSLVLKAAFPLFIGVFCRSDIPTAATGR